MQKVNEVSFIESKTLRDEYMNRVEVLEKVKDLFLIPSLEMMTTKQVADYFEVDMSSIRMCLHNFRDEIESDGVKKIKGSDAVQNIFTPHRKLGSSGYAIQLADGSEVNISTGSTIYFSKRAVLRIAMLLRDSKIAREVRTQLLNTFEHADDGRRTTDMSEEQELYMNVGRAMANGDLAAYQLASVELIAFKNRHIAQVEEVCKELEKKNEDLAAINSLLTKEAVEIKDPRRLLNYLVNVYSRVRWPQMHKAFRMSRAYNDVYGVMLNSEPHIDLKSRKVRRNKKTEIDCIEDDEFCFAISAVMGLIMYYNNGQAPEEISKNMCEIQAMIKEAKDAGSTVCLG